MQSIEEKLRFNKKRGGLFGGGYIMGVKTYRNYPLKDRKGKQTLKKAIDKFSEMAKSGDKFYKGFMCGFRDAANERKANNNN